MLALMGHNPMGNVLHVIMGPESEFFVDVHGAKILDVTELLNLMSEDERVYLSFTRCKNEGSTESALKAAKAPYMSSFSVGKCDNPDCPDCKTTPEAEPAAKPAKKTATNKKRCYYCHQDKVLLPLPGFNICTACAQIELGLKQIDKEDKSGKGGTKPKRGGKKDA